MPRQPRGTEPSPQSVVQPTMDDVHERIPPPQPSGYPDPIDDTLDDSFPASDPPSWPGLTFGGAGAPAAVDGTAPVATVKRMFAAFGAGDLDALVATVHPESEWHYYGANPRLSAATFTGQAAVRKFFQRILDRLEISEFNTDRFITEGDTVVVFGSEAGTVRTTGQPFRNVWTQKYVVSEDRITEMAEYNIQVEPRN